MSLFLATFFLIYGGVHAYALLKARSALGFGWGTALALSPVLALLAAAAIVIAGCESAQSGFRTFEPPTGGGQPVASQSGATAAPPTGAPASGAASAPAVRCSPR